MRLANVGHGERPAGAVEFVGAARLILGAPEVGQDVGEAPAGIAELPPVIVILVLAANVKQAVDRARSTEHFAARLDDLPVVQLRLRLGFVEPIDLGIVEQLAVAERDVDPHVAVMAAGLEQQDAIPAGFGQAVGEHATGGAGADDNVIEPRFIRNRRHARRPPFSLPELVGMMIAHSVTLRCEQSEPRRVTTPAPRPTSFEARHRTRSRWPRLLWARTSG